MPDFDEGELRTALRQVFDKFDADGSGAVSTDEMSAMVKQLKMDVSPVKVRRMMVEADRDMSGEIDFEEFCRALGVAFADRDAFVRQAFDLIDEDRNGTIDTFEQTIDGRPHCLDSFGLRGGKYEVGVFPCARDGKEKWSPEAGAGGWRDGYDSRCLSDQP